MISNADIALEFLRQVGVHVGWIARRAWVGRGLFVRRAFWWWLALWLATGLLVTASCIASVGVQIGLSVVALAIFTPSHLALQLFIFCMFCLCSLFEKEERTKEEIQKEELKRLREYAQMCDRLIEIDGQRVKHLEDELSNVRRNAVTFIGEIVGEYDDTLQAARRAVDHIQVEDPCGRGAVQHAMALLDNYQHVLHQQRHALRQLRNSDC
jgi:hypothetical protein